jgi:hypothetical protein
MSQSYSRLFRRPTLLTKNYNNNRCFCSKKKRLFLYKMEQEVCMTDSDLIGVACPVILLKGIELDMCRILILVFLVLKIPATAQVHSIYVSPGGSDHHAGLLSNPVKTLGKALEISNAYTGKQVSIQLLEGTYYLTETLKIQASLNLPAQLEIKAFENQRVKISAGRLLKPDWHHFHDGIYRATLPDDINFERLYVNGVLQTMARYPNQDSTAKIFNGTSEDATYYVRVLTWGNPSGGYVHGLDEKQKGSLHYRITGVDDTDNVELDGGWQYRYPVHLNQKYHFVENVLGELDTPGEWYLDTFLNMLYYYPKPDLDLSKAVFEVSNLKNSIELKGTATTPLKNITLKNLTFCHNERTFMDSRDTLIGTDWSVYRGGAVVLDGTENCKIEDCNFLDLGGNAIVFNNHNKKNAVTGCLISHVGANAVAFFGSPTNSMEKGKLSDCLVENNLFQYMGEIEKQGAGIHLNGMHRIEVRQNTIYHTPGPGIRIENFDANQLTWDRNAVIDSYREILPGNDKKNSEDEKSGGDSGVQKPSLKRLVFSDN